MIQARLSNMSYTPTIDNHFISIFHQFYSLNASFHSNNSISSFLPTAPLPKHSTIKRSYPLGLDLSLLKVHLSRRDANIYISGLKVSVSYQQYDFHERIQSCFVRTHGFQHTRHSESGVRVCSTATQQPSNTQLRNSTNNIYNILLYLDLSSSSTILSDL